MLSKINIFLKLRLAVSGNILLDVA